MKPNPGTGLGLGLAACALSLAVAQGQTEPAVPDAPPVLELKLERGLSPLSHERLADGSAAGQPAPVPVEPDPVPVEPAPGPVTDEPVASRPFSTLPAMLLGAVLLALTAFAAGVFSVRRRPVLERGDAAPVQLWTDAGALEQELEGLRDQLAEQQSLNESLQADRDAREEELAALRRQRDEAASESQILRMRADDDELNQAHETIDELREEIERLRGAETDLDHDPSNFAGKEPDALRAELEARAQHVSELEELMSTVRAERDSLEQTIAGRDAQIAALEQTLGDRDEELESLQGKLRSAGEQAGSAAAERITELSEELEAVRRDTTREIEGLQDQLNERNEAEERAQELLERNQQLDSELDQRRDELIQLAEQNDLLKAHMRDLELALKRDEDLTARLELGSLQFGESGEQGDEAQGFRAPLEQAQQRIRELEDELRETRQRIETAGDADDADLERQNIKLSAMILQRDNMVAELEAQLAALQSDPQQPEEWTSTVSSLENELRRKTTVIDAQADSLREDEQKLGELQAQVDSLTEQLAQSRAESESLGARLEQENAQVKRLREELERGAQSAPVGLHLTADTDIETLERTIAGRRELFAALHSIFEEQSSLLATARKRASERADLLVSLENEIASNRIAIAALQNRVSHAQDHGSSPPSGETQRLERELQRGARMIEKLRTDLHMWRRRVRPLHEAVMLRDNRIKSLDAQLRALRDAGLDALALPRRPAASAEPDPEQLEKDKYFQTIADLHEDIEGLETELAESALELSRVQAADETQMQEIENLEAARAAQLLRMDELNQELVAFGIQPEQAESDNVVELQVHRPNP